MLYVWHIQSIIKETLEENKIDIAYEANNHLNAPMSFNVSTNTLRFNYLQVNGYMSKINMKETEENFVRIMLFHELGYYLTFKKHKHDLRTLMYGEDEEVAELKEIIERNAWDYGRTLVPKPLVESYDSVREQDGILIKGL